MPRNNFLCIHCGRADWSSAPRYEAVYKAVAASRKPISAADVARQLKMASANVSNKLRYLGILGLVRAVPGPNKHNRFLWVAERRNA